MPLPEQVEHVDLRHPSLYLNRELSWLEFNRRVLHEALDARTPLLERLKFLAIFSSNLDEFFQVRVAGLRKQVAVRFQEPAEDGLTPEAQLAAISAAVRELQGLHDACLTTDVLPALAVAGIELATDPERLSAEDREFLRRYFTEQVFPVLTPLAVDPAHPFPYISNLSLSLAVILRGHGGNERFARVKVPKILPRWVPLPGVTRFVPPRAGHRPAPGGALPRRRDSRRLSVPDQPQHRPRDRSRGGGGPALADPGRGPQPPVRRSGAARGAFGHPALAPGTAPRGTQRGPGSRGLGLGSNDVYEVTGLLDAGDLLSLAGIERPELRDAPFTPVTQPRLAAVRNLFEVIREGDVFVHHPYDSFATSVERFLQLATEDPDVLAIKMTLYRTGGDSHIARMLTAAAERGKQVAVLIELQARFDEENNIRWAQRFEDVGVHVSYGVSGLKTHAKVILVVRREGDAIRRYVHIGTGNYQPKTARLYTDFGLFSSDADLGADLSDLFNVLTGFAAPAGYRKLIVAPDGMLPAVIGLIDREADHARAGRPARILAKMNAVNHPAVIEALYRASQAGVPIDLIVRGICALRPGVRGVSENIRVVSIIGRFLEHSRAWHFDNGGQAEAFITSADWMPRNLDRRIESATPIEDPGHRATLRALLERMWEDNRQAWVLDADGSWTQRHADGGPERATHRDLIEQYRTDTRRDG
ncbi:MAG: polyphosphate kinase 1 [Gemmatimonadales bacterium]